MGAAIPGLRTQMEHLDLQHLVVVYSPSEQKGLSAAQRVPMTAQGIYTFNMMGRDPVAPYALLNAFMLTSAEKQLQWRGSGNCAMATFDKLPRGVVAEEMSNDQVQGFQDAVLAKVDVAATHVLFGLRLSAERATCKKWYQ
jgi:hypothetical protein